MKAFLAAACMFVLTVTACHFYAGTHVRLEDGAYAAWTAECKSLSFEGLSRNLGEGVIPVFGSSEFQHGRDTVYHPSRLFSGTGLSPMLIGAGYYQCLSHAVTLAAIEPYMKEKKAVLILSPQWFRKTGVLSQAYASRFSERIYGRMLDQTKLSSDTVSYIRDRTKILLAEDEQVLSRIQAAEEVRLSEECGALTRFRVGAWDSFLKEKDCFSICVNETAAGLRRAGAGQPAGGTKAEPDWEGLMERAQAEGETDNTNPFFINNESYQRLVPYLDSKKGMNADAVKGYQSGPEFQDLVCFLTVCRETGIKPLLILVPVNGYYYDYTEFPRQARDAYYAKIREIAGRFDAELADLSGEEYTRYFFEDRVHLGKTGWILAGKAIWDYYTGMEDSAA